MKKPITSVSFILISFLLFTGVGCLENAEKPNNNPVRHTTTTSASEAKAAVNSTGSVSDFTVASNAITPAVVHVKTQFVASQTSSPFEQLYGAPSMRRIPVAGSGSGVIVSADGYIATNNHVIDRASDIQVFLPDRRSFKARLVGKDPNTDLALLKIDATDLPMAQLGNSDNVQIGEWVLAVGYPLSLNTTVTAGIISAKGRSIGIIDRRSSQNADPAAASTAIESFLQTDAAINPGNSGGALVNTNGEVVGINTAIASQTGSYAGYAFAIPINLAKKILDDLKKFGEVRRAILGVSFPAPIVEDQFLRQQGIDPGTVKGVYITDVVSGSAAAAAGLKEGDVIQSIDGTPIVSSSEFSERIARHRPGDVIELTYLRNGKTKSISVKLREESAAASRKTQTQQQILNKLGATFAPLSAALKQRYDLNAGVVVTDVRSGGFFDQLEIPEGTIIVMINGKPVNTPDEVGRAFVTAQSGVIQILGIAPDGSRIAFTFSLGT